MAVGEYVKKEKERKKELYFNMSTRKLWKAIFDKIHKF